MNYDTLPIRVSYVGESKQDDWAHDAWTVTLEGAGGTWSTTYRTGLGLRSKPKNTYSTAKPKAPTKRDIMESLLSDASAADENFADWCANFGYSDDSIRALNIYKACLETATALRRFIDRKTLDAIRADIDEANAA